MEKNRHSINLSSLSGCFVVHSILKHAATELSNADWCVITPHPLNGRPPWSKSTYVLVTIPRIGPKPRRETRKDMIAKRITLLVRITDCFSETFHRSKYILTREQKYLAIAFTFEFNETYERFISIKMNACFSSLGTNLWNRGTAVRAILCLVDDIFWLNRSVHLVHTVSILFLSAVPRRCWASSIQYQ
jgi:hypothetical protein